MTIPAYADQGTAASATTTAITPTLPTHAAGEYMLFAAEGDNTNFGSDPAPSGEAWPAVLAAISGNGTKLGMWARRATSSSQANPVLTPTGANHTHGNVFTFDTVHQVHPVHTVAQSGIGSNLARLLGGKTLVDDCLLVFLSTWATDSAGPAASAEAHSSLTLTERYDAGTLDGNGGGFSVHTAPIAAAGDFEAATYTDALAGGKAVATLALNPIADITITGSVEIDGVPVATGGTGEIRLYDLTQRAATYLVLNEATADAAITISDGGEAADYWLGRVPYTDHEYIAIYTDETGNIFGSSDRITYSAGFPVVTIEIFTGAGGGLVPPRVGSAFIR